MSDNITGSFSKRQTLNSDVAIIADCLSIAVFMYFFMLKNYYIRLIVSRKINEKKTEIYVNEESIYVDILASKFIVVMEIMKKHCLINFTGTPCILYVCYVSTKKHSVDSELVRQTNSLLSIIL